MFAREMQACVRSYTSACARVCYIVYAHMNICLLVPVWTWA